MESRGTSVAFVTNNITFAVALTSFSITSQGFWTIGVTITIWIRKIELIIVPSNWTYIFPKIKSQFSFNKYDYDRWIYFCILICKKYRNLYFDRYLVVVLRLLSRWPQRNNQYESRIFATNFCLLTLLVLKYCKDKSFKLRPKFIQCQ